VRVVVAEDSVLFREGLLRLLTDLGHEVTTAVSDAPALLAAVDHDRPDLAIVDVRMPSQQELDGAQAATLIRAQDPDVGLLLLSQHIELRHCLGLIGTSGFGYLLKDRVLRLDEFDDALRRVAGGGVALDPDVVQALVVTRQSPALARLTARETEVLALVAQGHSNTAIGTTLGLSERTVETHMRSIFGKLDLYDDGSTHRRVRAVVTYLESGADANTP
jgi:DNA-binding NarL/FixJ family response regulator